MLIAIVNNYIMKKLLLSLIFYILSAAIYAQTKSVEFSKDNFSDRKEQLKEAKENLKRGDELYKQSEMLFRNALPFYLKAQEFNPNNAELNFKIGNCLLHSADKSHAWEYIQKAIDLNPEIHPEAEYQLGCAYQLDDQFDKAIVHLNAYRSKNGKKLQ